MQSKKKKMSVTLKNPVKFNLTLKSPKTPSKANPRKKYV